MRGLLLTLIACLVSSATAIAEVAKVGSAAPHFTLKDAKGQDVSLSNFIGKTVVLEWYNSGCPFVRKFYANGDMQRFQKTVVDKGGVWLTIASSAEGKQGYIPPEEAQSEMVDMKMASSALLLDSAGTVGKLYGARTTPHMYVIDAKGNLVYAGAIDNKPSTRSSDIASATNYVLAAVDALTAGNAPSPASTEPYGCAVKYALHW